MGILLSTVRIQFNCVGKYKSCSFSFPLTLKAVESHWRLWDKGVTSLSGSEGSVQRWSQSLKWWWTERGTWGWGSGVRGGEEEVFCWFSPISSLTWRESSKEEAQRCLPQSLPANKSLELEVNWPSSVGQGCGQLQTPYQLPGKMPVEGN